MRTTRFRMVIFAGTVSFLMLLLSCASTPKPELPKPAEEPSQPSDKPIVSLYVPEQQERAFFSFDDSSILNELEIGSPESLLSAATKLRRSAPEYTQAEKVALVVASSIMNMVWSTEKNTIEVPAGNIEANPYTAAIDSAKIGIYDENTGSIDFFTLVLPSLVFVTSYNDTEYYLLAHESLLTALEINPNSVLVRYLLGILYLKMNNPEKAIVLFREAAQDSACFEIRYEQAKALFLAERYSEALNYSVSLLQSYPKNLALLKLCTEISMAQGNYTVSEQYIAQVLQQEPENLQYLLYRIKVLVEQENYIKAVPLLDVYARTDKSSKEYLLLRARIQLQWNKNSVAAAATLEEAIMLYPNDLDIILAAAELAAATNGVVRGKTAGQLAAEVLQQEPENKNALIICMNDATASRNWEEAYEYSSTLMQKNNPDLNIVISHIKVCIDSGRLEEAEKFANTLFSENPNSDEVKEVYIRVLDAVGKKESVLQLIQQLLPNASSQLKSFLYFMHSFYAETDTELLSDLRQSLTINPRNQEPLFRLYKYYFEKKDYRKAQYYLKQIVALNPTDQYYLELNQELDNLLKR